MIIGKFDDDYGFPIVSAMVGMSQFGAVGKVEFLLDTGAYATVLSPTDAGAIGIPLAKLTYDQQSSGIGGSQRHSEHPAVIIFYDSDKKFQVYSITVGIMENNPDTEDLPSILGRDVLHQWCITYDAPNDILVAEVRTSDMTKTEEEVIKLSGGT